MAISIALYVLARIGISPYYQDGMRASQIGEPCRIVIMLLKMLNKTHQEIPYIS
jgi:hypothetical protein